MARKKIDRNLALLPILDANTRDAIVFGFSRTEKGAQRIAKKWLAKHCDEKEPKFEIRFERGVALKYDPALHTRAEIHRVNMSRCGWIVKVAP